MPMIALQRVRLAHAVAADDRDRLVSHLELDALEDVRLAVEGVEPLDREDGLTRRHSGPLPR